MIRPVQALPCDHGQRRRTIVASLVTAVLQGQIRAGQHLVTEQLAREFGVSHTPIREALIELAGMGMIDLVPNRGAVVRRLGMTDVREICYVRRVLECEAARHACGRIAPQQLVELGAQLASLQAEAAATPEFIDRARTADNRLHDLVAQSCNNRFLANEIGRLKILFRACRDAYYDSDRSDSLRARLVKEAEEHLAIVVALAAGDRRAASRAMARHIWGAVGYWSRLIPGVEQTASGAIAVVEREGGPRRARARLQPE